MFFCPLGSSLALNKHHCALTLTNQNPRSETMAPISASKCPYMSAKPAEAAAKSEPPKLNLKSLRPAQPIDYDYAEELKKLNVEELTKDIVATLKDSQDWWPADYGHYGPFMVRLAWHSAGARRGATAAAVGPGAVRRGARGGGRPHRLGPPPPP